MNIELKSNQTFKTLQYRHIAYTYTYTLNLHTHSHTPTPTHSHWHTPSSSHTHPTTTTLPPITLPPLTPSHTHTPPSPSHTQGTRRQIQTLRAQISMMLRLRRFGRVSTNIGVYFMEGTDRHASLRTYIRSYILHT